MSPDAKREPEHPPRRTPDRVLVVRSPEADHTFDEGVDQDRLIRLLRESQVSARVGFKRRFVVLVLGPVNLNLIAITTGRVASSGCNVEAASCTDLGGNYALTLLISSADEVDAADLEQELESALSLGSVPADVEVSPVSIVDAPDLNQHLAFHLSCKSPELPGVLARITGSLAEHECWIESMSSRVTQLGFGGLPRCVIEMNLGVPLSANVTALRRDLAEIRSLLFEAVGDENPAMFVTLELSEQTGAGFRHDFGPMVPMQDQLALTVVGEARVGLVHRVCQPLAEARISIAGSSMAILDGRSVLHLVVEASPARSAEIAELLRTTLSELGLTLHLKAIDNPLKERLRDLRHPMWEFRASTRERAGVLAEFAGLFAYAGVEIQRLEARVSGHNAAQCVIQVLCRLGESRAAELEPQLIALADDIGAATPTWQMLRHL